MQVQIRKPNSAELNEVLHTIKYRMERPQEINHPSFTFKQHGTLSSKDINYLKWIGCVIEDTDCDDLKTSWEYKKLKPIV